MLAWNETQIKEDKATLNKGFVSNMHYVYYEWISLIEFEISFFFLYLYHDGNSRVKDKEK